MLHHDVRVPVKPVTTYPDVRNHEVVEPQLVPRLVIHSVGVGTEENLLLLRIRAETFSSSEDTTVTVEGTTRTTTFLRERSRGGERRGGAVGWHVECEELMGIFQAKRPSLITDSLGSSITHNSPTGIHPQNRPLSGLYWC